jgi:triosephosphate isomerase (TIM)
MRSPLVVGNWKMHKDSAETASFCEAFQALIDGTAHCEVVLCPPLIAIETAVGATRGMRIQIGAQNLHWEKEGAFTGEVSGPMIRASGCSYVIVGHSERRKYFGETNESVAQKALAALDAGLTPIVCIGEFEKQNARDFIAKQFLGCLGTLSAEQFGRVVVAYEPFWAIGSGDVAAPATAGEAHGFIRGQAGEIFGKETARKLRLLYGGSVKPDNAAGLAAVPEIDGFLVGGASLDPAAFAAIVSFWTPRGASHSGG